MYWYQMIISIQYAGIYHKGWLIIKQMNKNKINGCLKLMHSEKNKMPFKLFLNTKENKEIVIVSNKESQCQQLDTHHKPSMFITSH